ncbi:MAG: putative hydrolase [Candidatus Angelobacter sp.]|nr:putative hydrolase [Candidatus Angelobacter sp.]
MRIIITIFSLLLATFAQDPVAVDPQHNKVEYEDAKIRVIRFTLAPGEKSAMHDHPEMLVVNLTNAQVRITSANGEVQDIDFHAGEVLHRGPVRHAAENIGNTVWENVFTEFKPLNYATALPVPQPKTLPRAAAPPEQPAPRVEPPPPPIVATADPVPTNSAGTKSLFVNGTDLAYIDRGQGPPIVFVHDTLGDYRSWQRQFAALSRNHHVIAYSRRYHFPSHSTGKEGDYSFEQNAKDLAEFIRALNLGPVAVVGHGYGATVAAIAASEHPELVKSLIISEPGFEALLDSSRAYRSRYAREEIFGIIRKPLSKGDVEKPVQIYMDWLGAEKWSNLGAEDQYRRKQNSNALRALTASPLAPTFACADAKKITVPTLLISGERRSPNSAEINGILSACIPNAERATVLNSGPAPYLDNPDEYTRLLTEFIAKH